MTLTVLSTYGCDWSISKHLVKHLLITVKKIKNLVYVVTNEELDHIYIYEILFNYNINT